MQNYLPYRKSLLNPDELGELSQLKPSRAFNNVLFNWTLILLLWYWIYISTHIAIKVLLLITISTRIYALLVIAHDGLHRRIFNSIKQNDNFTDILILGSVFAITRINRVNHITHHQLLSTPNDPDRYKYISETRKNKLEFIFRITAIPMLFQSVRNVFINKKRTAQSIKYSIRDVTIILVWQLTLVTILTCIFGFFGYVIYWILPCIIALLLDLLRVFCEHSVQGDDNIADENMRLVSYDSNFFEKFFFSPNNMNHHIAHHLWPSIPFYNLKKAESIIRERLGKNSKLVWRKSYISHILNYYKYLN
jgi:fatty acid desaturase